MHVTSLFSTGWTSTVTSWKIDRGGERERPKVNNVLTPTNSRLDFSLPFIATNLQTPESQITDHKWEWASLVFGLMSEIKPDKNWDTLALCCALGRHETKEEGQGGQGFSFESIPHPRSGRLALAFKKIFQLNPASVQIAWVCLSI